jgi:large subunit ribosomal protein L31
MKKGIHPKIYKKVDVVCNGQTVMNVMSTSKVINVEIWSGNHPFYTGQEFLVDTDNLVEKFNSKINLAKSTNRSSKQEKRVKRAEKRKVVTDGKSLTLKDMLQNL